MMFNLFKKKNKFDIENPKFVVFNTLENTKEFKTYCNDNNSCIISSYDNKIQIIIIDKSGLEAFNKCKIAIESLLLDEFIKTKGSMNMNKFINSNLWKINIYSSI